MFLRRLLIVALSLVLVILLHDLENPLLAFVVTALLTLAIVLMGGEAASNFYNHHKKTGAEPPPFEDAAAWGMAAALLISTGVIYSALDSFPHLTERRILAYTALYFVGLTFCFEYCVKLYARKKTPLVTFSSWGFKKKST